MPITSTQELTEQFGIRAQTADLRVECPSQGSYLSRIAVVAEAPGQAEIAQRAPLVGPSGRLLWNSLKQFGNVSRNDCYVTNVSKRQTQFGVMESAADKMSKHEKTAWQELLRWELQQLPNLQYVVVCGGDALEALYDVTGISHYRGSVLDAQLNDRPLHRRLP